MKEQICKGIFLALVFFLSQGLQAKEYSIQDAMNPNNANRKAYIAKYKDLAIAEMERVGIPASIKLAQGILESGDGMSELAKNARNHFGMKCGSSWTGDTYYLKDDDYDSNGNLVKSCFRVFKKAEESYKAHSEFLLDEKKIRRYGFLFDLDMRDYRAWAKALKRAGYATNPNYPKLLISIIEANRLYEYDYLKLFDLGLPGYRPKPVKPVSPSSSPVRPVAEEEVDINVNEVVLNNGVRMVFAQEGDTPRSLSESFGVSAKKITIYNELYEGGRLKFEKGDRIYLQPKRKRWRGKVRYHKVKPYETMYEIAQMYGMRVSSLYYRNRMRNGTEPAIGQSLSLKRRIKRSKRIKLRNPKLDGDKPTPTVPTPKPDVNQPVADEPKELLYDLSDGKNLVDIIRVNVNAQDLNKRTDAYLKITEGRPNTPPYTPPNPTPSQPSNPTTQPTRPTPSPPSVNPPSPPPATASYHVVQSGDTLYGIARRYGVPVSKIKTLNRLSSNIISVGQRLRVR